MFFNDIAVPGSPVSEPVSRYNAVNMLLRSELSAAEEVALLQNSMSVVQCFNVSETPLPRFQAVAITGVHASDGLLDPEDRAWGQAVVTGIPAVNDLFPYGIALEEILPETSGEVAVCGCVPAFFSGTGKFVTPSSAGLTAGSSGSSGVVCYPQERAGYGIVPGLIRLGFSHQVQSDEYFGAFKLRSLSAMSVEIFSSYEPEADFCGSTDIPGLDFIPRTVMNFEDLSRKNIYLVFFYENGVYRSEFRCDLPVEMVFYRLLGTFQNGVVDQIWQSDSGRMIFGEEWYLR